MHVGARAAAGTTRNPEPGPRNRETGSVRSAARSLTVILAMIAFCGDAAVPSAASAAVPNPNPAARYKTHVIDEINLNGMTPSFVDIGREKIALGRYISESDYQHNARVCVIGPDLVDKLFPNVDPLDKEVSLAGLPFRVIGVTERQGSTFGQSQDNFAVVPLTTFRSIWMGRPELLVFIKAPDGRHMVELQDEVRALMRARRHVPYREEDTFGINASDTLMSRLEEPDGHDFRRDHRSGGRIHGGGRNRDHEHHAGQRDGADPRDRHPQVGGSAPAGHPVAVRHRGRSDV